MQEDRPSFFVSVGVGGLAEEIVDGCVVNAGKLDKDRGRDVIIPRFILAVTRLGHVQQGCYLGLCQISIFTHISNTLIAHLITSKIFYTIPIWNIDKYNKTEYNEIE